MKKFLAIPLLVVGALLLGAFPNRIDGGNSAHCGLLLHFNGTGATVVDSSSIGHTITVAGDATQSATQSVFGGKSLALDGTGDYITAPDHATFNLAGGDFCIGARVRISSTGATQEIIGQAVGADGSGNSVIAIRINSSNQFTAFCRDTTSETQFGLCTSTATASANTWYEITYVRRGTSFTLYVDGGSVATATPSSLLVKDGASPVNIGRNPGASLYLTGYIDELRWVTGDACHASNYTIQNREY